MHRKQLTIAFLITLHIAVSPMELHLTFTDEFIEDTSKSNVIDSMYAFSDIQTKYKEIKDDVFTVLKKSNADDLKKDLHKNVKVLEDLIIKKSQQSLFQHDLNANKEYISLIILHKFINQKMNPTNNRLQTKDLIGSPLQKNETFFQALIRTQNIEMLRKICRKYQVNNGNGCKTDAFSSKELLQELLIEEQLSNTDLNETTVNGDTLLHYACRQKSQQAAKILIESGVELALTNKDGLTPFHIAIYNNKPKIAKLFFEVPQFDITQPSTSEQSPLYMAVKQASAGMVNTLLATKKFDVNIQTADKHLLHNAVERGDLGIIESLLKIDAIHKNVCDDKQRTILDYALQAKKKNADLIVSLIKHGVICKAPIKKDGFKILNEIAQTKKYMQTLGTCEQQYLNSILTPSPNQKKKKKTSKKCFKAKAKKGSTRSSIFNAPQVDSHKQSSQINIDKIFDKLIDLIKKHSEIEVKELHGTKKELDDILFSDYYKSKLFGRLKSLLNQEVGKVIINGCNTKGKYLIDYAAIYNDIEIVQELINAGIDKEILKNNCTPYLASMHFDNEEILALLINSAEMDEQKIFEDFTLLHYACRYNALKSIKMLIAKYGGNKYIYHKNEINKTPAQLTNSSEVIDYLDLHFNEMRSLIKAKHFSEVEKKINSDNPTYITCLNIIDKYGDFLLKVAVESGSTKMVKLLIDNGADITQLNIMHTSSVFFKAIDKNNAEILALLLEAAALNMKTVFEEMQLLNYAISQNQLRCVTLLIEKYGPRYINYNNNDGLAPIDIARSDEMKSFLLQYGASIREVKKEPTTPNLSQKISDAFFNSCESGNLEYVTMCLENNLGDVAWRNQDGLTPLHVAAKNGYCKMAKFLIAYGADKNAGTYPDENDTPLATTLREFPTNLIFYNEDNQVTVINHLETLRLLTGPFDPKFIELKNKVLYFNSISKSDIPMVKLFLGLGKMNNDIIFEWENENDDGVLESALHTAVGYGQTEMVRLLIDFEFPINKTDSTGKTALTQIKFNLNNCESLSLLLQAGINVKHIDNKGRTVIWDILKELRKADELLGCKVIQALISAGADINLKDNNNETLVHWMVRKGYDFDRVFLVLLKNKVDLYQTNKEGKTSLDYIIEHYSNIPKILIKIGELEHFAQTVKNQKNRVYMPKKMKRPLS